VAALLRVLQKLVDAGNTVVVIEHHLDVMKNADWIIDLGPGAGDKGGNIVAEGTPEEIAANKKSLTGEYLKQAYEWMDDVKAGKLPVDAKEKTEISPVKSEEFAPSNPL
jgi:energy-coupling factor transporter ATP-binding protein EcfA2